MDQASALAIGSAIGSADGMCSQPAPVVDIPLRPSYDDCTGRGAVGIAEATISSVLTELSQHSGHPSHQEVIDALRSLVVALVDMAEGKASPSIFLSSLDPGVGKTTTLIHFVRHLLGSAEHRDVAVLLCVPRLEEIDRLVKEAGLKPRDFAVLTSDEEVNRLSSTWFGDARVLFTTHAMVVSRCRGRSFRDTEVFHYCGKVREVRLWDEAMLPGEVVSITTDQLAALREPLRTKQPALAELIERLEGELIASTGQGTLLWPKVGKETGVSLVSARRGLERRHASYLEDIYALSGQCVFLRKPHNASTVITALNSRDAIPDDLAPVVVLDASGRVRKTYEMLEKRKGSLVRLPSAVRCYRNLTVHVMDRGAGKTAWTKDDGELAQEVAHLIDSKPDEKWLVVYHHAVNGGTIPDQIKGFLSTDQHRVSFVNWGKHQGTNEFRHIPNVILAGINHYSPTDYEMMARYYGGVDCEESVPECLVREIEQGEHQHHILQAMCRSAIRQGRGNECGPSNAYIMGPARSGIRRFLPAVFPGCSVKTWKPTKRKAKGKVHDALTYVEMHFADYPYKPLLLSELKDALEIACPSNFNKTIRKHESFKEGLEALGVEEIALGNHRYRNAIAKKTSCFGPIEGGGYIADV